MQLWVTSMVAAMLAASSHGTDSSFLLPRYGYKCFARRSAPGFVVVNSTERATAWCVSIDGKREWSFALPERMLAIGVDAADRS